ncbi:MAG TPA: hypothetical protein VEA59_06165 [Patescibacteria group bacterium]|nr:hypothetical protein [Patescibacteria group bacterium]
MKHILLFLLILTSGPVFAQDTGWVTGRDGDCITLSRERITKENDKTLTEVIFIKHCQGQFSETGEVKVASLTKTERLDTTLTDLIKLIKLPFKINKAERKKVGLVESAETKIQTPFPASLIPDFAIKFLNSDEAKSAPEPVQTLLKMWNSEKMQRAVHKAKY